MKIDIKLLEAIVGAAKLQGKVEYNRGFEQGSVMARIGILSEYTKKYKSLLAPHRDSIPIISKIMDFFDFQKEHESEYMGY